MTGRSFKVIVPCYRYADVLEGCVESVLSEREVDVRVLIIDDCSPDHTEGVAAGIQRRDDRVEYRRNDRNLGLIATANEGLQWAADSDYHLLLSADDRLVPGALGRAARVMEERPEVGLVYGHARYVSPGEAAPASGRWRGGFKVWAGEDWIRLRCRSGHNCISSPEAVVRTSVQRSVGGYDPRCTHASDLNMWLRLAAVADVAYLRGTTQALYMVHADSMLRSDPSPMLDLTERRAAFECFFSDCGSGLTDARGLRRAAQRALARQALWQASRGYDRGDPRDEADPLAEELVEFALSTFEDTRSLPEWRGLQLRRRLGAGRSGWFPPFLATGAAHRVRSQAAHVRWRFRGV